MATISTFGLDASNEALATDLTYIVARCEARPLTAGLAPPLLAALADVDTTQAQEKQLVLTVTRAQVLVVAAGEDIGGVVDGVVHALLTITGGDREHALYLHFLGTTRPRDLKARTLAKQVVAVRAWVPSLTASPHASLTALGSVVEQMATAADKAVEQLAGATQALKDFREVGGRKAMIDRVNATRKTTYGALGEILHANPLGNLPNDFADRFFLHARRRPKVTIQELTAKIEAAKADVVALEAKLAKLQASEEAEADAREREKAAARQSKLAAAEKKAARAAAELAALRDQPVE
jgi:hypothetical protein